MSFENSMGTSTSESSDVRENSTSEHDRQQHTPPMESQDGDNDTAPEIKVSTIENSPRFDESDGSDGELEGSYDVNEGHDGDISGSLKGSGKLFFTIFKYPFFTSLSLRPSLAQPLALA